MLNKFWLSNNEPCPCGSNKIYSKCCKNKPHKSFHNNNEALHFTGKMLKKSKRRFCLYEGCTEKGKNVIQAHAIQENRILNKLSYNGNVIMQDFSKNPTILEITKGKPEPFYFLTEVPITSATTATCFCKNHDDMLFSKIEKFQYDLESLDSEQLFLFAYKTFSFELYTQMTANKFNSLMFSNVPQIAKNPLVINQYRNSKAKLEDLQCYKTYFDNALKNKDFCELESIILEIPFEIQFANYMAISPPFDITGKKVKAFDKNTKRLKFVFFTSFPIKNKSYILISALKEDMKYFSKYFKEIRNAPLNLVEYYLNAFIPLYSQNLIMSPLLWNKWNEKTQYGIQFAVADPHSSKILPKLKAYLKYISTSKQMINISPNDIAFNFFISV